VGLLQTNPQQVSETTHTTKKFQGQRSSTLDQKGHQEKPQKTTQIIQIEEENW
jgi:hypothetical protein